MEVSMQMVQKKNENFPYRFTLKSEIHRAGYILQRDFCRSAGITEAEVTRILRGLAPTVRQLRKMAKALSLTTAQLRELL